MKNRKPKILFVDDDKVDQAAFKRLVAKGALSYDCLIAESVSETKKILSTETFDVMVIDYKLNDGTAFDIISSSIGVPFIIVTGAGDEEIAVKAMKAGAYDYVIKDINHNYLKVLPVVLEKALINKEKENHSQLMSYALMSINDSVFFTDMENKILFINKAFYKTHGYDEKDIIGKRCDIFWKNISLNEYGNYGLIDITKKGVWCGESYHQHKNGKIFPIYLSRSIIRDENGKELGIVNIVRDMTERKAIEQRLEYMAHFDGLTGLPNRTLFYNTMSKILAQAERANYACAILFLDLDRFKIINDTLGHDVGDTLLTMAAERLKTCIRKADIVARLGGDEFAIILTNINEHENAAYVARRVISCFKVPFQIKQEHECTIGVSIGITIYPADGNHIGILVKNADTAMYHAKGNGGNSYHFYESSMNTAAFWKFTIEKKLREAIRREEFLFHYQPQIDTKTKKIVGVEALIRWQPPDSELVLPEKFVSVAEETGLIIPIGEWALYTACIQNRVWQNNGILPVPISVNVSARQFKQRDFVKILTQILHKTKLDSCFLEIELTESILMHDEELILTKLRLLNNRGIKLSIDDFGTGYSSMRYLKHLPIHRIKIDKSFVNDIATNPNDRAISEAIITMAHSLQIKVIAEGVETEEQFEILQSLGCDEIQGHFFCKPLSINEFTSILAKGIVL